jgi:hypothetical protein
MAETETSATGLANGAAPAGGAVEPAKPKSGKPSLSDVLAKKAAGGVLTAQERGILGAEKRRAMAGLKFTPLRETAPFLVTHNPPPMPVPSPALTPAPVAAGENPLLPPEAPDVAAPVAVADAALSAEACRLAADAICDTIDNTGRLYVGWQAEKAGADIRTQREYESAVALQPRNRQLMVDGSEPVVRFLCRWFKCEPDKLKDILQGSGFAAGLMAHGLAVTAAVKSIGQSKAQRPAPPTPADPPKEP